MLTCSLEQAEVYGRLWHLLIPPVMTILDDDYEAKYKLYGVHIVNKMLQTVPKPLLKRTGIDTLFAEVSAYIEWGIIMIDYSVSTQMSESTP